MKVHFVVHESFEAPGAYETWARSRGYALSFSRVYLGDSLPTSAQEIDLLIVMGGPQDPKTTKAECPHFDANAEIELIAKCISHNRAVIGICLGSQLIGEALGAPFDHSPEKEIGKFPITLTKDGRSNKKFSHFEDTLDVGHWHNDMPGLTKDAKILAYSEGCPRQIVEYSNLVYGFQCHMELTTEVVELLIKASENDFEKLRNHRFVQQPHELRKNDYTQMNERLIVFLDKLVEDYKCINS